MHSGDVLEFYSQDELERFSWYTGVRAVKWFWPVTGIVVALLTVGIFLVRAAHMASMVLTGTVLSMVAAVVMVVYVAYLIHAGVAYRSGLRELNDKYTMFTKSESYKTMEYLCRGLELSVKHGVRLTDFEAFVNFRARDYMLDLARQDVGQFKQYIESLTKARDNLAEAREKLIEYEKQYRDYRRYFEPYEKIIDEVATFELYYYYITVSGNRKSETRYLSVQFLEDILHEVLHGKESK